MAINFDLTQVQYPQKQGVVAQGQAPQMQAPAAQAAPTDQGGGLLDGLMKLKDFLMPAPQQDQATNSDQYPNQDPHPLVQQAVENGPENVKPTSGLEAGLNEVSNNMDKNLGIQSAIDAAKKVYPDNPVMAQLAATQAILESGLASGKPSGLAAKYNNYFGIKGHGDAGSASMPTREFVNGQWIKVPQPFASYSSPEGSFAAHRDLMNKSRYSAVSQAADPEQAFNAVWKAGYATDPHYPKLLSGIWNKYVKSAF